MMRKKIVVGWLSFLWLISGILINHGYAQEYTEEDLNKVSIDFCNEGTGNLKDRDTLYIEPGKEKELCLYIVNGWSKKIVFDYGFTMGKATASGTPMCQWTADTGNNFSRLIPQTQERTITIDPMTYKIIKEKVVIPPGMSGLQMGCLTYKLKQPEFVVAGGMFNMEIRHSRYLSIIIWWESTVKSKINLLNITGGVFVTSNKIKVEVDEENAMKLSFRIENEWNISQDIIITWKVYNALWFQKDFAIVGKTLSPWVINEFSVDAGILPSYKWFFTIKFNVQNTPQFMFPISDEKLKMPGNIDEKVKVFVFSWIAIIAIVILLLLLYKILIPRRKRTTTA